MVRQPSRFPKRKRVFIGAEGESERSLAKLLGTLCDEQGLSFYLDIVVCGGGDSLAVTEHAVRKYRRRERLYGHFSTGWILLDYDRLEQDMKSGRNPKPKADAENLKLVYLKPNIEGVLLRFHPGQEKQLPAANNAERKLRKFWPEYRKPASAEKLRKRFTTEDIRRAARHDSGLRWILEKLTLWDG